MIAIKLFVRVVVAVYLAYSAVPTALAQEVVNTDKFLYEPMVDHVIHISVDGLRGDLVEDLVNASSTEYMNFKRLKDEGTYTFNARTDFFRTITLPNHTAMLTGRPVLPPDGQPDSVAHGWLRNEGGWPDETTLHSNNPFVEYVASTFDVSHDASLLTRMFANKAKFKLYGTSYSERFGRPDINLAGGDNGRNKVDESFIVDFQFLNGTDITPRELLTPPLLESLRMTPAGRSSYTFVHFADPDKVGHKFGWDTPNWNASVLAVDGYLGEVLAAIEETPVLNGHAAIVLTADHGGEGSEHGNPGKQEDYTVPLLVWGLPAPFRGDLYDVFGDDFGVADPSDSQIDFNLAIQPLRNGSTANISMLLLGLDFVPGSTIFRAKKWPLSSWHGRKEEASQPEPAVSQLSN